jgi:hypothetical protein
MLILFWGGDFPFFSFAVSALDIAIPWHGTTRMIAYKQVSGAVYLCVFYLASELSLWGYNPL